MIVGFLGVRLIIQPGSTAFHLRSVFTLLDALCNAFSDILNCRLRAADSSTTMACYSSLVYLRRRRLSASEPFFAGRRQPGFAELPACTRKLIQPTHP